MFPKILGMVERRFLFNWPLLLKSRHYTRLFCYCDKTVLPVAVWTAEDYPGWRKTMWETSRLDCPIRHWPVAATVNSCGTHSQALTMLQLNLRVPQVGKLRKTGDGPSKGFRQKLSQGFLWFLVPKRTNSFLYK